MSLTALRIVRKFFPKVEVVTDGEKPLTITVTKADNQSAKVRDHQACAMAVACKRMLKADGVIVSVSKAYVVFGKHAIRYHLPESVSREVVSFDRDAGFEVGIYNLTPPGPSSRLGAIRGTHGQKTGEKKKIRRVHHTGGIRTTLGVGISHSESA